MPGRRPIKEGSFSAHFDELVKHFPPEKSQQESVSGRPPKGKKPPRTPACVNRALLGTPH